MYDMYKCMKCGGPRGLGWEVEASEVLVSLKQGRQQRQQRLWTAIFLFFFSPHPCLMMPYHWPAALRKLPGSVAMATITYQEMRHVFRVLPPFSTGDRVSVFIFCIFFFQPLLLYKRTSHGELALLNKTYAWNKWCNCLRVQPNVYSLTLSWQSVRPFMTVKCKSIPGRVMCEFEPFKECSAYMHG